MAEVKLPVGMSEFEEFVTSIETKFDLPTKDKDSVRFLIATAILNLGQEVDKKDEEFFVRLIHAAAAKQVAAQVFQDIKIRQKEAEQKAKEEAAAAKLLEATKKDDASSDFAQG